MAPFFRETKALGPRFKIQSQHNRFVLRGNYLPTGAALPTVPHFLIVMKVIDSYSVWLCLNG